MGPFEVWTTARSGESAGVAGGGGVVASSAFLDEHPARNNPAEAAIAERPNSLRLRVPEFLSADVPDPQVPHPLEWQVPQPFPDELSMTLNVSSMLYSPFGWFIERAESDVSTPCTPWPARVICSCKARMTTAKTDSHHQVATRWISADTDGCLRPVPPAGTNRGKDYPSPAIAVVDQL